MAHDVEELIDSRIHFKGLGLLHFYVCNTRTPRERRAFTSCIPVPFRKSMGHNETQVSTPIFQITGMPAGERGSLLIFRYGGISENRKTKIVFIREKRGNGCFAGVNKSLKKPKSCVSTWTCLIFTEAEPIKLLSEPSRIAGFRSVLLWSG